uniref:Solute carrier family 23 member 3 n=1 Tax=Chelonoidis abingdonii TaxID=106734 RepID=A0A8C0HAQ3_CHEAB
RPGNSAWPCAWSWKISENALSRSGTGWGSSWGRSWGHHHRLLIPCSPQVSGAVVVSGLVQLALGVSGVGGWVAQHCGPMVLAPTLSIIGLSAYKEAAHFCSASWGVALLVLLAILFSQHLGSCRLPLCTWTRAKGISVETSIPALRMFSVRGPVLRAALSFPVGPGHLHVHWDLLGPATWHLPTANGTLRSPWLQVPYPGRMGDRAGPAVHSLSRALGVGVAMGITSSMNSVGCYLLCPRALRAPALPRHACNRGLCTEGLGSLLLGALGGVSGTASSIPNACTNSLTQVRRVTWVGGLWACQANLELPLHCGAPVWPACGAAGKGVAGGITEAAQLWAVLPPPCRRVLSTPKLDVCLHQGPSQGSSHASEGLDQMAQVAWMPLAALVAAR